MSYLDFDASNILPNTAGMRQVGNKAPYGYPNPKHIDLDKIDKLTLADYHLTKRDVEMYTYGLSIIDKETGQEMPEENWNTFIIKAIAETEHALGITIFPIPIADELHDHNLSEYYANNFIQLDKHPVVQVQQIGMTFNGQPIMNYPAPMWKVYNISGQIETYPADLIGNGGGYTGGNFSPTTLGLAGIPMWNNTNLTVTNYAPQIHTVSYVAGLLPPKDNLRVRPWEMPEDLRALICKRTLVDALEIWGELILKPGIAGTSISADGLSQSVQSAMSAENTGASARLILVKREIADLMEGLGNYFGDSNTMLTTL